MHNYVVPGAEADYSEVLLKAFNRQYKNPNGEVN